MPKLKKNFNAIQAWLHTQAGQTFLNYAYSWGASIVILGALFKLTHITGADIMLFIGMGTEVIVFFLSGFDTPLVEEDAANEIAKADISDASEGEEQVALQGAPVVLGGVGGGGGGTIIIGGSGGGAVQTAAVEGGAVQQPVGGSGPIVIGGGGGPVYTGPVGGTAAVGVPNTSVSASSSATGIPTDGTDEGTATEAVDAAALASNLSHVTIPDFPGMPPAMQEATQAYVEQLNELTETLRKVAEQSARLTRDSEEMETMNRTLTSINRFYEMQLRSVGQQSATIDDVNTQTQRLAEQLAELNGVYARMVEALKMKVG